MKLRPLIETLENHHIYPDGIEDFDVQGITCNSKEVSDNFIFVAIKGSQTNGHKFIKEAIDKGAKAIVVQSKNHKVQTAKEIVFIKVEDSRLALVKLAAEFYHNPSTKIKVVGITGTNGKTTVSYLIEALLKEAGFLPAVIGTVNYRFKNKIIPSTNTTPGPLGLQSMLADMAVENIDYAIMEVSSHALSQNRTESIDFHSAIFTNLTQDHLDYHKTLENYFRAKTKLFKNLDSNSFSVINNDSEYGRRLKKLIPNKKIITYAIDSPADIMATDIKSEVSHTKFTVVQDKRKIDFKTRLIGIHNVYNILASFAWGLREGLDPMIIKTALERFHSAPGRLERIKCRRGFSVFVDYAHTEDALFNVISALRQISCDRIIVVFGCGGERDKTKRPKMGYVVSKLSDYAIITNDNPRSEDPQEIINDITRGIRKNNYCIIPDRKEAIRRALLLAKENDIVLIAGKGHEDYQILKDKKIHFSDQEAVKECLGLRN